jgi:membrane-bound ClpP family serine protease
MNTTSRTITGLILIVGGLALIILAIVVPQAWIVFLFYGIPSFIIGLFILFNYKEDKIEQIKLKGGKKK